MKYQIIAKIVGPYLSDSYLVGDIELVKEDIVSPSQQFPSEGVGMERYIEDCQLSHRIAYSAKKLHYRKFDSSHVIRIFIENENINEAFNLARARIEHLVESLTIASFNIDKIHPQQATKMSRNIGDIYQYQIIGIFDENGEMADDLYGTNFSTAVNYFPKKASLDLEVLAEDILGCIDDTFIKMMFYLKRAKIFSFDYYSELEIYLNSMKCIELLANKFYSHSLKKQNGKSVSFKERINGFDAESGIASILGIEDEYKDIALGGWDCRNKLDIAHASEYPQSAAWPFPEALNRAAYHFTLKYIEFLKTNSPRFFVKADKLGNDWWSRFRY